MVTTEQENRHISSDQVDIVAVTRQYAVALPARGKVPSQTEGQAVAAILEQLGLPRPLIAAAELYPLVRDGHVALDDLAPTPLGELREMLDGLLQFGRFSLPPDWQPGEALAVSQSEALRRMLLAVVSDVRLVLIRIAEQLHRLRAAKNISGDQQRALAIEAREIYAPLASRLGVWQLKWELEDLAFRYLEPESYTRIVHALNEKRTEREAAIEGVRKTFAAELAGNGVTADVSARPKHIYSIWRKMQRKDSGLEHIFDLRAVRVLVDSVSDCYAALGIVHNRWSYLSGEFDDYVAKPKENSYRSLHTAVIGPGNQAVEVQIRTHEMHRQAELGVAAHWRYKEGKESGSAKPAFDQKIQFLRQLLEPAERDGDLLEQIRGDVFEDRVYALSPKGDVVEMPEGSTPLDFAYHVHTQVGHRCRGAKVNGRIVPLTYKVQNGDKIEIITGKEPQPSRDWLSPQNRYLAAARSRAKVRNWFRRQDKEQNRKQGRDMLDRELSRLNVRDLASDEIADQLKLNNTDALCVALGAGDITSTAVANAIQRLRKDVIEPQVPAKRRRPRKGTADEQVEIRGVGDLLCNLARCCRPVPPEDIVGYITIGRGVSIHRQNCGNFASLYSRHPERVIDVEWRDPADENYPAELVLEAYDRQGLLRDVSSVLADENISVDSVLTKTDHQRMQAHMELCIFVPGLAALSSVIGKLEQLPNVTSVRRKS